MDEKKNVGGILIAFLAGTVLGAAAGLLLAPSSGSDTRNKIKASSLDVKDKALEKVESVKAETSSLMERGKEKVAGVKSQIHSAVEAGKGAYSKKKGELVEEVEEETEEA